MIWKWLKQLFKKRRRGDVRPPEWPTAEQISLLPWFDGLNQDQIVVIETKEGARRAFDELVKADVVGFDTESKPTFKKGELSSGPHVVQFSTLKQAYIFMLHESECRKIAGQLIQSAELKKVGFGLSDDIKRIRIKLKVDPRAVLDVETLFAAKGHGRGVGVKIAVAIALRRRFNKSKKVSTSNWGARHLTDLQLLYAANDAYAAIKTFHAITKSKAVR